MTLVITLLAAAIATIAWYAAGSKSTMKIGVLALMYWGAGLMWIVDGIACLAEGEAFMPSWVAWSLLRVLSRGRFICLSKTQKAPCSILCVGLRPNAFCGLRLLCDTAQSLQYLRIIARGATHKARALQSRMIRKTERTAQSASTPMDTRAHRRRPPMEPIRVVAARQDLRKLTRIPHPIEDLG